MKTYYIFFSLFLITISSFGQVPFEKGYFIDNDNYKSECLIKNQNWKYNPVGFEYKLTNEDIVRDVTISMVKEFGIDSVFKFVRFTVEIDRTSKATKERNPIWSIEQLFLEVVVEGKATLYSYKEENMLRFFYSNSDSTPKQLIYKPYLLENGTIATNNQFRQQLWLDVKNEKNNVNSLQSINYKQNELVRYFKNYNNSTGKPYLVYKKNIHSKDWIKNIQKVPSGMSVQCGLGNMALKDFYISKEKYSGYTKNLYLGWNKYHQSHLSRTEFDYRYGENIENFGVSTSILQFSLNKINLYPIGWFKLFSKNASIYIGPSVDIMGHYRQQNIATDGNVYNAISMFGLLSAGFNTDIIYPFSGKFNLIINNNFSALSFGFRRGVTGNIDAKSDSPTKFLSPFNGLNFKTNISVNYQLNKYLSMNLGYQSFLSRITAWKGNEFYCVSDNLFVTLTYNLK